MRARVSGRDPSQIRLIAVTKQQDPAVLPHLDALGIRDLGENRLEHHSAMLAAAASRQFTWHAIGRIQGRQLRKLVPLADCLHSLHDVGHLERLAHACRDAGKRLPVFCQVNTADEEQKAGIRPADLPQLLDAAHAYNDAFEIIGLMTMAPDADLPWVTEDIIRHCFSSATRARYCQWFIATLNGHEQGPADCHRGRRHGCSHWYGSFSAGGMTTPSTVLLIRHNDLASHCWLGARVMMGMFG